MSFLEYLIGFLIGAAFTVIFVKQGPMGPNGPMGEPGRNGRDA